MVWDGVRCIKMAPMPWAVDLVRFNGRKVKEFEMQFGGWRLEKEHCRVADWFWPTVWHALYVCVEGFWSWKRIWDKGRWGDDELRQCLRDGTKGKGTKFLCCRLNEFEWKRAVRRGRNGELLRQSPFAIILTTWECMGHSVRVFVWKIKNCIEWLSDPSGADLTLGLVFFLLQLWFSSSPVHTKRHSGLPYCHIGQRSEMWWQQALWARWYRRDGEGEIVKARLWRREGEGEMVI